MVGNRKLQEQETNTTLVMVLNSRKQQAEWFVGKVT